MKQTQTAAQRLAEAMFVSSVAVQVIVQSSPGVEALVEILDELTIEYGPAQLLAAARTLERAYDRICAEILVEP